MSEQEISVKRSSYLVPFAREVAIDAGLIEPTPAERADRERSVEYWRRRAAEQATRLNAARHRLDGVTDPLSRAVLDLHSEDERGTCKGCDFDGYEAERPNWPCRTVEVVAAQYGIELEAP